MSEWLKSLIFGVLIVSPYFCSHAQAQITPDQTLGQEASRIRAELNNDFIDGGAIRDSNLFHSFQEFSIDEGRGAYFTNPGGVNNIFSRVTGGNISEILGTLGVLGNANLFLLNPNGIIFGENASLDVNGSFIASTADSLVFGDEFAFSASNPTQVPPLLTINLIPGLQYGTNNSQSTIINSGNLTVGDRQRLTLAGNQVTSTGSLTAPGGTIKILGRESIALLGNATIDVSSSTGGGTVLIGGDFQGRDTVPNAKRTYVGNNVSIKADALANGNGGRAIVWADEVTGFYGKISAKGGLESGDGGLVEVSGKEHLIFRGQVDTSAVNGLPGTLLLDPTNIIIANGSGDEAGDGTDTFAGNNSGVVGSILSAPLSEIDDTAPTTIYESELEGLSGDTNIILQATNNITLQDLSDDSLELAAGAGVIALSADADRDGVGDFVMEDEVADTIFTNGRNITIDGANLAISNINTSVSSLANSGSINGNATKGNITARDLNTTSSLADAGAVSLNANGNININLRIQTRSFTGNGGDMSLTAGGNITINPRASILSLGSLAGDITLSSKGDISIARSGIVSNNLTQNESNGLGGDITMAANSIFLINGTFLNAITSGQSNSGLIKLTANDSISLTGQSPLGSSRIGSVVASSDALGNSAGIIIETNNLFLSDGAVISANTFGEGNAGTITITATESVTLSGENSQGGSFISSVVGLGAEGTAGGITINTGSLSLKDGASVSASTLEVGDAGDITITATDAITLEGEDKIGFPSSIASTVEPKAQGTAGSITIEAGSLSLKGGARLSSSTRGIGNAGAIAITATESITLSGRGRFPSGIASQVDQGAKGDSKGISITTGSLSLTDGAEVSASTEGEGKAGDIAITA